MSSVSRRRFLAGTAAAAAAGMLSSCRGDAPSVGPTSAAVTSASSSTTVATATTTTTAVPGTTAATPAGSGDRVLVVVNLYGGNDGLNTVVPLDGRYHDLRPVIGIADDMLVPLPGTTRYGLHPALAPLSALAAGGQLAVVHALGFPSPNRSHFAAQDDWASSRPGQALTAGWLGRWLDGLGSDDAHPLRAVGLSGNAPMVVGTSTRPTVVTNPAAFSFRSNGRRDLVSRWAVTGGTGLEAAVRTANALAVSSVETFASLQAAGDHDTNGDDPDDGEFTAALTTAARVASGAPGVRVVHVALGGFDTHSAQPVTHERLLRDLATGIVRFQQAVTAAGAADRVVLMTVSEFGRRVADNGYGTDHGKANVQFLVGGPVRGGVYGEADLGRLDDGDLRATTDVRAYYAGVLDWLGADPVTVLGRNWEGLGLLRP